MEAPYLYVTAHNDRNVVKIGRDGCLMQRQTLWGGFARNRGGLRSIKEGLYLGSPALYVADSGKLKKNDYSHWSKILVFGEASWWTPYRSYKALIYEGSDPDYHPGSHPYGISFDDEGNVYASFQHTDNVLRWKKDTFEPMVLPSALSNQSDTVPLGTFVQYGEVGIHHSNEQGIRSVQWVGDHMWVANENQKEELDRVTIFNKDGYHVTKINQRKPIGIYYNPSEENDLVFVGTKASSSGSHSGKVIAYDKTTYEVKHVYMSDSLQHPTGMVTYNGILYVAEQYANGLHLFDIETAKYLNVVDLSVHLKGDVEQLELTWN